MVNVPITVEATLQADGVTLQLEKKLELPPGRVTVTVQPQPSGVGPTALEILESIHRDQRLRGHVPMTEEQMKAEIASMDAEDEEYEEDWRQIWANTVSGNRSGE